MENQQDINELNELKLQYNLLQQECLMIKKKYNDEIITNKNNKSELVNYMKSMSNKLKDLQNKLDISNNEIIKYKLIIDRMKSLLKMCLISIDPISDKVESSISRNIMSSSTIVMSNKYNTEEKSNMSSSTTN